MHGHFLRRVVFFTSICGNVVQTLLYPLVKPVGSHARYILGRMRIGDRFRLPEDEIVWKGYAFQPSNHLPGGNSRRICRNHDNVCMLALAKNKWCL